MTVIVSWAIRTVKGTSQSQWMARAEDLWAGLGPVMCCWAERCNWCTVSGLCRDGLSAQRKDYSYSNLPLNGWLVLYSETAPIRLPRSPAMCSSGSSSGQNVSNVKFATKFQAVVSNFPANRSGILFEAIVRPKMKSVTHFHLFQTWMTFFFSAKYKIILKKVSTVCSYNVDFHCINQDIFSEYRLFYFAQDRFGRTWE